MGINPAFAGSSGPGSQGQDGETAAPLTRISLVSSWVQEGRRTYQKTGAPAECSQLPHQGKRLSLAPKQPLALKGPLLPSPFASSWIPNSE